MISEPHSILNPLLHIVLDRPKIAGNIAAIVRLSVGMPCALHICGPLLFENNDKTKWRAGLDYFYSARVHFHQNLKRCLALFNKEPWIIEVGSNKSPWDIGFSCSDIVVLGPEDGSVDEEIRLKYQNRILTLPQKGPIRSLNLAQCAAITTYEAYRQIYGLKNAV